MQHNKRAVVTGVALLSALALAGCAGGGGSTEGGGADASACAPSDGDVTLEFTSWIPGIEDVAVGRCAGGGIRAAAVGASAAAGASGERERAEQCDACDDCPLVVLHDLPY